MSRYVLKRLLLMIPTMLFVVILVFTINYFSEGDPVSDILGPEATQAQIDAKREELGLNDPYHEQLFRYIKGIVTEFDFGMSYKTGKNVIDEVLDRFPTTLLLTLCSMGIAVVVGITLGVISAVKQYSVFDYIATFLSLVGVSIPSFWLGLMLIIAFSVNLKWLPSSGFYGPEYWILPAITVGLVQAATVMRQTRSAMLDVVRQDYIRTAKAKGQTELKVVLGHALPNALIPIITVLGMQFGHGLGGAVISEQIFAIPGIGKLMVDSITARDYPVVQGGVLMIAISFTVVNLLVDILYAFIDPRIKALYVGKKAKRKQKEDGKGAAAV